MNEGKKSKDALQAVPHPQPDHSRELLDLLWMRFPLLARRVSKTFPALLADGIYLTAWPAVGVIAPPSAFLFGAINGWFHPFSGPTFTYSVAVMAVMVLVAGAGAGLGVWMLAGYALTDFFLATHSSYYSFPEGLIYARAPLLISYMLLGMLLVTIPWAGGVLRRRTVPRLRTGRTLRMIADSIVQGAIAAGLTFVWVESVPTLIRPVFTWPGGSPPIEAIRPLQENGIYLIVIAAMVTMARIVVEYQASQKRQVVQRVAGLSARLAHVQPAIPAKLPLPVAVVFKCVTITFLLSGILTTWLDATLFAIASAAILMARPLVLKPASALARLIARVPVLLRIAAGILASYFIANLVMHAMWNSTSTFRPVTISITASMLLFALLLPEASPAPKTAGTGRAA